MFYWNTCGAIGGYKIQIHYMNEFFFKNLERYAKSCYNVVPRVEYEELKSVRI